MKKTPRERKEKLFDTFVANLSLYCTECSGRFGCPLCMRTFDRSQLAELDLAHIVPEALGGRHTTLTCKACNNRIGTEVEAHEIRKAQMKNAMEIRGSRPIRGRVQIRVGEHTSVRIGAEFSGETSEMGRGMLVNLPEKMSNPAEIRRLMGMLQAASVDRQPDCNINIELPINVNPVRAHTTYLHIAYLALFHQFGYEWVADPHREPMRQQFRSPDDQAVVPRVFALSSVPDHMKTLSIQIIRDPECVKCLIENNAGELV